MSAAVALEVEQQIAAARIDALTASLVRELVDAKLAEHGLVVGFRVADTRYRFLGYNQKMHRRLGLDVAKGGYLLVSVDDVGRDGAADDLDVVAHDLSPICGN